MKAKYIYTLIAGLFFLGNVLAESAVAAEPVVKTVPNYARNFDLFMAFVILTGILLLAISMIAVNIKSLLSSDFYRDKLIAKKTAAQKDSDGSSSVLPLVILGVLVLSGNSAMALTFNPEEGGNGMPWLRVENSDLTLLLVLDIVLLFVFFYLRKLFTQLLSNIRAEKKEIEVKAMTTSFKKINSVLTDSVPIEYEESITLDHEYDGIKELDNNLPPWWVVMFFITIIFSVAYLFHYHILKTGDLQLAEYNKEVKKANVEVQEYLAKMAMNVDETNATVMTGADDLAAGKTIFKNNCVVCHKEKGEGDIGPNLTDDYWLYTGDIKAMFGVIKKGTVNGMPEHASKLNPIQIQQVASYVWNLPYAEGKEPQGEKYVKEPEAAE